MTALVWSTSTLPWRRIAGQATAWWLTELAGMLPASLRSRWARRSAGTLRLEFARNTASLLMPARDRSAPRIIPVALTAGERASSDWSRFAGLPVRIRLGESLLFRPIVELPLAAERSLGSILRHQLERLVPLDPETLRFTWTVIERLPAKNRLKVEVCIVKQVTLDRALALAHALKLMPQAIIVENAEHAAATMWRAPAAPQVSSRLRMVERGLEFVALCCAVSAYGLLVWHLDAKRAALRDMVSELQGRSQTVEALSKRASTAEGILSEVNSRLAAPPPLAVLDALTRTIPLDGFVSECHLQGDSVEISGTASHATTLLAAIEQEKLFQSPSFLAPIIAGAQGTGEHYQLGFRVRERLPQ